MYGFAATGAPPRTAPHRGLRGKMADHHERSRMSEKQDRDIERVYSTSEFVAKLRRLADSLETGERFEIQVAGERIYVPARAEVNVEHEREGDEEELEFQLKWTHS